MTKPIYVLGTGLSHNGSSVLLKDGRVHTAIEKERLTRKKHDGGNDTLTVEYCLNTAGIRLADIDVVVQCENFSYPKRHQFGGPRPFANDSQLPVIDISHHLAHAYSAAGTCPFEQAHILVIDGCGSPYDQVIDKPPGSVITPDIESLLKSAFLCEKDSFYYFNGHDIEPVIKDFSEAGMHKHLPMTHHSIGGFYAAVSNYVFGDMSDVGKLMGLAPFGNHGNIKQQAFRFENAQLKMHSEWHSPLTSPAASYEDFKANFQYFADVAAWAQDQVTNAVCDMVSDRMSGRKNRNLCYSGGVALNIVANSKLISQGLVDNLYVEPAAGDNGLALGCAYYGWLEVLKKERVLHDGGTCFGKPYSATEVAQASHILNASWFKAYPTDDEQSVLAQCASMLAAGKILGWFQEGAEFGPRALGHRSILAHPGIADLHQRINRDVKKREDFRPFAPSVLTEDAALYFESGESSPYMLSIDLTKPDYAEALCNITHRDGTARLQTVSSEAQPKFARLLNAFKKESGLGVLLNTSLNRRGQPIVETPGQAMELFQNSALDGLVMGNRLLIKTSST